MVIIFGTSCEQFSEASGHLVWKRQPDGGLIGEGISPLGIIYWKSSVSSSGKVNIEADIKARV